MPGSEVVPIGMTQTTTFGFVVDHHAFWGVPIPGFAIEPQPATSPPLPPPAPGVPSSLQVVSAKTTVDAWTGSDFSVLASRWPPLFHALHHQTTFGQPFERRLEPDDPELKGLPGKGREALVSLFDQNFIGEVREPEPIKLPGPIPIGDFDKKSLFEQSMKDGYFATKRGEWDVGNLGVLGALWIVILQADKQNTPLDLGDGYRLWHYKAHHKNTFYTWKIEQDDSFKELYIEIVIGRNPHGEVGPTGVATLEMNLKWN